MVLGEHDQAVHRQQNVAHNEQADVSGDGFVGLVVLAEVGVDELGDDITGGPLGKGKLLGATQVSYQNPGISTSSKRPR